MNFLNRRLYLVLNILFVSQSYMYSAGKSAGTEVPKAVLGPTLPLKKGDSLAKLLKQAYPSDCKYCPQLLEHVAKGIASPAAKHILQGKLGKEDQEKLAQALLNAYLVATTYVSLENIDIKHKEKHVKVIHAIHKLYDAIKAEKKK